MSIADTAQVAFTGAPIYLIFGELNVYHQVEQRPTETAIGAFPFNKVK